MLVQMATAKKAPAVKTARADGRAKSALTIVGETAKLEAERALLQETLVANGWNLTRCAVLLRVGSASAVLRAIDRCGLCDEYTKHRIAALKA